MNRRKILAALAVMAGGTLAAAAPASAASPFSCIGTGTDANNIASGVEVNVAFTGTFPEVVAGRKFTISPTIQYKLSNDYLKGLGEKGLLNDGENRLGGLTFWVPIAASNTVEGRQYMRAVIQPGNGAQRVWWDDATDTVTVQRYSTANGQSAGVPVGPRMQDFTGTLSLSGASTYWTPSSSAPVSFSVANAGSLGVVKVRDEWRRAQVANPPAPTDALWGGGAPDVDPLTTARPYGNLYVRLRIGQNGRTSLDCVSGVVAIQDSTIAYNAAGNAAAPNGDAGRYFISAGAAPAFAAVAPRATPKSFSCIDGLGSYVGREINAYDIKLTAPAQGAYTPGQPFALSGVKVDITLPAVMLQGLYGNLLSYQSLPAGGVVDQPLRIWVAVQGTNTTQGVQTVLIEGRWTGSFRDPDGVPGTGDESFPDVALSYTMPNSTWTPNGNGPVAFSVAAPAQIPELTLVGFGHSGDAGAVFPMNPYGSFFVRAETGRYGASIDCLEGQIDFADTSIARSNLGRLSPTVRIPEPVAAGAAPNGRTTAAGSAGRYSIVHQAGAPFAIVPAAPAAAPLPAAKPVAAIRSLSVKSSKLRISLRCTGAACAGTVKAATTGRHRINGKLKQLDLTKSVKYSVKANSTATVSINLTKDAKALLKKKQKLGVTITVTPASGTKFTKKLTLKT